MPLPWKKSTGSRISRFVKDFQDLQSPKRGKSLVVETGFPTSLVDLFVKNRDRLKNSSKKRKEKKQQQERGEVVDHQLVITDPVPSAGFKDSPDHAFTDPGIGDRGRDNLVEARSGYFLDGCEKLVSALPTEENAALPVDDANRCWGEDEKRVTLVVLKVFVVVVLGLSTKELAVGITMSAFVLLFLEYAGKHILCFLSPCSKARLALDPFVQKICSFFSALKQFKIRQGSSKFRDGNALDDISSVVDSCVLVNNPQLHCSVEEIQSAESSFHMASQSEESRREDLPGVDKRCGESSDVGRKLGTVKLDECRSGGGGGGGLGCEKGCSQSGKSKRKIMKKFVPKKFLKRKKGKKNGKDKETDSEASSSCRAEDKLGKAGVMEEQQQGGGYSEDFKNKGELLPLPLLEGRHERGEGTGEGKEEIDGSSYACTTRLQTKTDMVATKKKGEVLRKGSSCLPIVFVVVLAGLMGGRIPALLLTVSSCLILRMVQRYSRYV